MSTFVGRERELAEILEHGRDERVRLLTLTGPGGSGKTRLALAAAHQLLPNHPDGVLWVNLTPVREAGLVVPTIAQLLGAKVPLAVHIRKRRMLLLLDNFEQVVDAAPDLIELLLSCPNLRLLVTSRELLRTSGEMEYRVPPLDAPDAVALFCERARLEPDDDIESLCERLDNLPLAIELAAARTNVLSPAQILERLTDRFDLFTGVRDAHSRQSSLRAMMEWSHDLLDERERTLFARLSIFASCTVEAAEVVCDATVDALSSLVDKSLLRLSGERFSMLETIHQYALSAWRRVTIGSSSRGVTLSTSPPLPRRRMCRLMRPGGRLWEERLEAELGDIRLALGWAREHDVDLGLRLAASLTLFWMGHNLLERGGTLVHRALGARRGRIGLRPRQGDDGRRSVCRSQRRSRPGRAAARARARALSQARRPLRHCVVAQRSCPEPHGERPARSAPAGASRKRCRSIVNWGTSSA